MRCPLFGEATQISAVFYISKFYDMWANLPLPSNVKKLRVEGSFAPKLLNRYGGQKVK